MNRWITKEKEKIIPGVVKGLYQMIGVTPLARFFGCYPAFQVFEQSQTGASLDLVIIGGAAHLANIKRLNVFNATLRNFLV